MAENLESKLKDENQANISNTKDNRKRNIGLAYLASFITSVGTGIYAAYAYSEPSTNSLLNYSLMMASLAGGTLTGALGLSYWQTECSVHDSMD